MKTGIFKLFQENFCTNTACELVFCFYGVNKTCWNEILRFVNCLVLNSKRLPSAGHNKIFHRN